MQLNFYPLKRAVRGVINIDRIQGYLDKLEKELKLITNKFKKENSIFKMLYQLDYPLERCYNEIRDHYEW